MTESLRPPFSRVALVGKINHEATRKTLQKLEQMLLEQDIELTIESRTAEQLDSTKAKLQPLDCLGEHADLAVVVGGDGNMLGAARALCEAQIAVIGVNRGNLGFLTDLDPDHVCNQLQDVLAGKYQIENRFLVQAEIYRDGEHVDVGRAINEVVLHSDKVAHMIEFEVFVDDEFAFSQRSDGLIVSTPTGSTAYSLSGGGPILTPGLNAISLISMFPHALSARPLVIDADSTVRLRTPTSNDKLQISCDGHVRMTVEPGDEVVIGKHPHLLRMVHPQDHSYYRVLRNKLGWGSRLF